jgi:DNA processing protein
VSRVLVRELGSLSESEALDRLSRHPALSEAERNRLSRNYEEKLAEGLQAGIRPLTEEEFPPLLAEAAGMPAALFVHGSTECLTAPTIAIVGTRSASTYGKACAQKFAEAFARAGVTVVSGGALGIDAAAHRGVLDAGGSTVAVLASGVDHVYPSVHRDLFRQIRENGCLVSQFPVGSHPTGIRFLTRNVLIAALSRAVLVIEAPRRSGAMSTAHAANDLGREVFVVPANIDALSFHGSFGLIRDGATLVSHPAEVLEALDVAPSLPFESKPAATGLGKRILDALSVSPIAAEVIVARTGIETAEVLSELTMLELEGRIVRDGGGYAVRP